jgi:hypothetical protein
MKRALFVIFFCLLLISVVPAGVSAITLDKLDTPIKTTPTKIWPGNPVSISGILNIESDPGGADITVLMGSERVNKDQTWTTPYSLQLHTATYQVILKKPGYMTYYSKLITLQPDQTSTVYAVLVPNASTSVQPQTSDSPAYNTPANPQISAQQTPVQTAILGSETRQSSAPSAGSPTVQQPLTGTGSLSVTTNPAGARIFIDSIPAGASPAIIPGLSAGVHNLTMTMPGYAELITQVNIVDGQTMDYSTTLIPATEPTKQKSPGFYALVAGLAVACIVLLKRPA